jgi:histidyl-tRNA synthetase
VGCKQCRPQFLAMLRKTLAEVAGSMCEDCQRRTTTNPLRVLDCKVPDDQPIIDGLPSILDHLCEDCSAHFTTVRGYLDGRNIPYEVRPRLVRGLDYYTRTTFEITHGALGAQNSVLGGGRYDGLAEAIGSKVAAPGIGFSIGEDRLVLSLTEADPEKYKAVVDVVLAPMGAAAEAHAGELAAELRSAGISVERSVDKKLKRTLDVANRTGARFALILGEDEVASGNYSLKEMATGEQIQLKRAELADHIKSTTGDAN